MPLLKSALAELLGLLVPGSEGSVADSEEGLDLLTCHP